MSVSDPGRKDVEELRRGWRHACAAASVVRHSNRRRRSSGAEFFATTLGLRLDHADDSGWVFTVPGCGKVEVDGPHVADWQHFTTGPVAGFLVDDVVAATEELRRAGIAILSGPFTFENGVAWVHFRGPDGNVYGLTQGHDLEPTE